MEIRFVDDGKGKYQSIEAHLDIDASESMGHMNFSATAYGSTKLEALENLRKILDSSIDEILERGGPRRNTESIRMGVEGDSYN